MCIVSSVHDYGRKLPDSIWTQPHVYPAFEDLIKRAQEFDKAAKQPHCEDPEKTAFMEVLRKKHGAELEKAQADAKAEADRLRDEVRSLKRQLSVAQADIKVQQEALREAHAEHEWTKDDFDSLKIGYARMAIDAGMKVKVSGAGEYFTALEIELPTGPVRYHIDNQYADLLAGLPYGLVEKGTIARETQALRLTQSFNYDFEQTLIPEEVTPETIMAIFPTPIDDTPARPPEEEEPFAAFRQDITDTRLRLDTLTGDGSGVALPRVSSEVRVSAADLSRLWGSASGGSSGGAAG